MWYEKQIEGFFNLICAYWVIWGLLVERFIQMEWPCHLYKQSKEKRSIHTYVVYCWTSYSCPLIYTSIWIQILHYLDYCYCIVLTSDSHVTKQCGDIEKKEISYKSCNLIFFPQNYFDYVLSISIQILSTCQFLQTSLLGFWLA